MTMTLRATSEVMNLNSFSDAYVSFASNYLALTQAGSHLAPCGLSFNLPMSIHTHSTDPQVAQCPLTPPLACLLDHSRLDRLP